jgi:hypothetical protein
MVAQVVRMGQARFKLKVDLAVLHLLQIARV